MPKHETQNTFYWVTWEVNFHFLIEIVLSFLQGPGTRFQVVVFGKKVDNFYIFCNVT